MYKSVLVPDQLSSVVECSRPHATCLQIFKRRWKSHGPNLAKEGTPAPDLTATLRNAWLARQMCLDSL